MRQATRAASCQAELARWGAIEGVHLERDTRSLLAFSVPVRMGTCQTTRVCVRGKNDVCHAIMHEYWANVWLLCGLQLRSWWRNSCMIRCCACQSDRHVW